MKLIWSKKYGHIHTAKNGVQNYLVNNLIGYKISELQKVIYDFSKTFDKPKNVTVEMVQGNWSKFVEYIKELNKIRYK